MITPTCPACRQVIPPDDVNVAKDVAYCRECNVAHQLSAMATGETAEFSIAEGADLANPPAGCSVVPDGLGTTIVAHHRQFAGAFMLLFMALFWNGITGIFVTIALAATLQNTFGSVPAWFPSPITDEEPMSVGMNLFLWLFLSPFILIGAGMFGAVLLSLAGRTEVRFERTGSCIFTGVGPIGYRRRFEPQQVTDISSGFTSWSQNGEHKPLLVMKLKDGAERKFGSMLLPERQKFLAAAIVQAMQRVGGARQLSARR